MRRGARFAASGAAHRLSLMGDVVAIALVVASCGGSGSPIADSPTTTSSPFTAAVVPRGYKLAVAGVGRQYQNWGSDSFGTDEPFTVLSPDGRPTGPGVVVVSSTGFTGYEGGLGQASQGYGPGVVHSTVGGHDAIYAPPVTSGDGAHSAELLVDRGHDVAIRVTKASATQAELVSIERLVVPAHNHRDAPRVPRLPEGLRRVGHVDADAVMALSAFVAAGEAGIPGSARSHSIGWTAGSSSLVAMTLPGDSVDVAAFGALPATPNGRRGSTREVTVDGRAGVEYSERDYSKDAAGNPVKPASLVPRMVLTTTAWGDALAVNALPACCATPAVVPLDTASLIATAASVAKVTPGKWKALRVKAFGGPGLQPDANRVAVDRGTQGGISWLLQTNAKGNSRPIDPCLKLSTLRRACADGGGGFYGGPESISISAAKGSADLGGLPPFMIVSTDQKGASVTVTNEAGHPSGTLHRLPGGKRWAGIVFLKASPAKPTVYGCVEPAVTSEGILIGRIDVLDAAGKPVGCIGIKPN